MATIKGNSYGNTLNGTSSADYIYGYGGNDTLNGNGGSDHLYGGDGADKLDGGLGIDWLYGDGGSDILYFGGYADHYDGGSGTDTLSLQKKTSGWTLNEITSHDIESAGGSLANIEKVIGSNYADTIRMNVGTIDGAGGNDQLFGGAGSNQLNGGSGSDALYGGDGADKLDGGTGNDYTFGQGGDDVLYTDTFQDLLDGGVGTDTLSFEKHTSGVSFRTDGDYDSFNAAGGLWNSIEKVKGSPYGDNLFVAQGHGVSVVDGLGGNDNLYGEGPITLYGGSGNDNLIWRGTHGANGTVGYGGSGNDNLNMMDMTGGTGSDTFELMAFGGVLGNNEWAVVRDFHHGEDHLLIDTGTGPGTLTHSGDLWTVHDQAGDFTFVLEDVTSLSGSDYTWG